VPLKLRTPLPSFEGATTWLNGAPPSPERLRGAPVLVHFWAIGCHTCKEQMPTVARWRQELEPRGLRVVGVHIPVEATPPETDAGSVATTVRELGISHPIAVDEVGHLAHVFGVTGTPAYLVFDSAGALRHYQLGEGAEEPVEAALLRVLEETEQRSSHPPP